MTITQSQRIRSASAARILGQLAVLLGLAAAAGCSPLSSIETGACGNLVLEPNSQEDCDGFAQDGIPCYPPGSPNECRLDCTGDGSTHPCPTGWSCGTDFVCRTPSGGFEPVGSPISEDALVYALADFDGDARTDLLSSGSADIRIHYQDPGEVLGQTLIIPTTGTYPAVGDVNGDAIDDFTMNVGFGVGIMLGQKNRTTTPAAFPAVQVSKTVQMPMNTIEQARMISIGNPSASLLDSVFLVAELAGPLPPKGWYLAGADVGSSGKPFDLGAARPLSLDTSLPLPSIATGRVADDPLQRLCEQIAVAFPGEQRVGVHLPCTRGSTANNPVDISLINQPMPFPVTVTLPAQSRVGGRIWFMQIDADSRPDLVIAATCGLHCYEIDVAFGASDGSYHSSSPAPVAGGDGFASRYAGVPIGMLPPGSTGTEQGFLPLAVGHLNTDGILDYVNAFSVHFGRLELGPPIQFGFYRAFDNPSSDAWTDALIADFNANGLPDIIAGASTRPDIDFLNGTGTDAVNPFRITTAAGVDQFTVGDFDGDLILDLAFAQGGVVTTAGEPPKKSVAVAFGQPSGGPASPMIVGHFESIGQILGMNYGFPDAMTDLGILYANDTDFFLNLAFGSSIRQIQSPFTLVDYLKGIIHVPMRSLLGRFGGQGPSDLAILTAGLAAGGGSADYRSGLWLAQSDAQGRFDKNAAGSAELDMRKVTFNGHTLSLIDGAVADLDQDQADELVLSLPVADGDPMSGVPPKLSGGLTIARVDGGAWKLDPTVASQEARFFLGFRHDDINADSYSDVTALEVNLKRDMSGQLTGYETRIAVFWGSPTGLLDPAVAPAPAGADPSYFQPTALALLNMDGDSAQEIVAIANTGVFVVDTDSTSTLNAPTPVEGLPGGTLISAGDLTGDGVDDLVVGSFGSTYVFRGVPVLR